MNAYKYDLNTFSKDNQVQFPYLDGNENPFAKIEFYNYQKRLQKWSFDKEKKHAIETHFIHCNKTIRSRLTQLAHALSLNKNEHFFKYLIRLLSQRSNFLWRIFSETLKYRIISNPKEGSWSLELSAHKHSAYNQGYLAKVQIGLNQEHYPSSFHLIRGSDNKTFDTKSMCKDELSELLLCHFSRMNCGSNQEEDVEHIRTLYERGIISNQTYDKARAMLLSKKTSTNLLYILPKKSPTRQIEQQVRRKRLFCIMCILTIVAILMYAINEGSVITESISVDLSPP